LALQDLLPHCWKHFELAIIELDDGKFLQESPIFDGKKPWFPVNFQNQ